MPSTWVRSMVSRSRAATTALHLAIAALQLEPGAEIVMSSSTNIATALAAYHNGHLAIPIDSEPVTWNIDLELVESRITPRTRAIIPVHLFGHPVDMDAVQEIALRHDLVVIEDCAESHGATVRGRMTGGLGDMGCFSFYANKIITTGEGGMVTTNDDSLAERLRLLRNLAFGKPQVPPSRARVQLSDDGLSGCDGSDAATEDRLHHRAEAACRSRLRRCTRRRARDPHSG